MRRAGLPNRTQAKNFFYGLLFGAGVGKIAKVTKKSTTEAKQLLEFYFEQMPGLKALLDKLKLEWKQTAKKIYNPKFNRMEYHNGYITGLDGRPIRVTNEHELLVYLLQSDEAIQMAAAYVWFCAAMDKEGYVWDRDWAMLIWYHDEFQIECRPEIAGHVKWLAEQSITWAGKFYSIDCPHEGDGKYGYSWAETH